MTPLVAIALIEIEVVMVWNERNEYQLLNAKLDNNYLDTDLQNKYFFYWIRNPIFQILIYKPNIPDVEFK